MSRTDVGANLDSSFRKSATIIRELACTGLIPDQRFNRQLVPSGPARRNSGNARTKTSGVARHKENKKLAGLSSKHSGPTAGVDVVFGNQEQVGTVLDDDGLSFCAPEPPQYTIHR